MVNEGDPTIADGTELALSLAAELATQCAELSPDDPQALRDAIACVYAIVAALERRAKQSFAEIDEATLAHAAQEWALHMAQAGVILAPQDTGQPPVYEAAILLRALEQLRLDHDRAIEGDGPGDLEDACRTSDGRHYVIPRASSVIARTGNPFVRRALLHHRVLPTEVQGFALRLHRNSAITSAANVQRLREGGGRRLGAAFFPNLNVNATHGETDFIVDGVSGFDAETLIDGHVDRARKDDCSGIVWAELTMPEAHVALLQESLARHALDDGTAPDFIVAGSCHRDMEGSMRNVSRILDGSGSTIFELVKWAKFLLDGHFEAIEPGTEIPVLITGGEIVVMAICRDFLDEADEEPPYCQLDVDLAIVPSMANLAPTTTMDGHIATARTMSIRFGTQTMVVQQPPSPDPTGRSGQVMLYPKRPIANAQPITVETPWMFCQLETL